MAAALRALLIFSGLGISAGAGAGAGATATATATATTTATATVSQVLSIDRGGLDLGGGASYVPGHGVPSGYDVALRTGSPGQTTSATLHDVLLSPAPHVASLTSLTFEYRYVSGYGPSGRLVQFSSVRFSSVQSMW